MLSVITDFGCSKGCWYCIHRQCSRATPDYSDRYYSNLELAIRNSGDVFSISGGGDPLHNFEQNELFWNHIFSLCIETGKHVDIHTAYLDVLLDKWTFFDPIIRKAAVHCFPDTWEADKSKILKLRELSPSSRINFVVDKSLIERIDAIELFCHTHRINFSYRELVAPGELIDTSVLKEVRSRTPYGYYIEQGDYNIYLTPAGELKLRYSEV